MNYAKNKTTIAIALILMFTMAFSLVALPAVYAQVELIMNPETFLVELHESIDIDLNGPSSELYDISLVVTYPGRSFWTVAGTYNTTSGGDLDVYDFDFNETGDFRIKWVWQSVESQTETITCVLDRPQREHITYTYVGVAPPTVGVNQAVDIVFWSNTIPPTARGALGDRYDFYVYITDPEGTEETLGPITSDPVGGAYTMYTPTKIGTYTVVAENTGIEELTGEPGNTLDADVGDKVLASTSPPCTFTVQEEPIPKYVETPLPTDYWTRPIHGNNRDWYTLAGNWLGSYAMVANNSQRINLYSEGPQSSHILWTKPYWSGGVADGYFGTRDYYSGQSYESYTGPNIILDGKIYYDVDQPPREGWYCVDLYTGETMYFRNTTGDPTETWHGRFDYSGNLQYGAPSYGQVLDIETPNQHGCFSYLWVSSTGKDNTWDMLDGYTGNYICSIENVHTGGAMFRDDIGSLCFINFVNLGTSSNPNYYMQVWNTTESIWFEPEFGSVPPRSPNWQITEGESNTYWMWRPDLGATFDGNNGFSMNVSVASIEGPSNSVGSIQAVRPGEYVVVGTDGQNNDEAVEKGFLRAISLKRPNWGQTLWDVTFTPPKADTPRVHDTYEGGIQGMTVDPDDNVFFFNEPTTLTIWAYSIDTGQEIWSWTFEEQWSYYEFRSNYGGFTYNGNYYSYGYTGIMHCIDVKTGTELWNWSAPSEGLGETWYPYTPLEQGPISREGYVYLYTSEHSPDTPFRRDANIWCVDLNTGEMYWKLSAWRTGGPVLADGKLVYWDGMDSQMYCIGKGPSATTVTASPKASVYGSSVLIEGTVTDQSPSGRRNTNDLLDWTLKGTPAISDEDMDAWMEYMFHQRPIPEDAKGVEVVLETIDPNGNYYEIGNTTSDITGSYGFTFTPEVPGTYQIIATFEGSRSYGPSFAHTYLTVEEAPQATPTAPPPEPSMADIYFMPMSIGIIIAIVAVGLLLVLMLRKR